MRFVLLHDEGLYEFKEEATCHETVQPPLAGHALWLFLLTGASGSVRAELTPIEVLTEDGVTVFGEPYLADFPETAPLILLLHQGGSSDRGEYAPLAAWLNYAGFRAIAWGQRSGGDVHGVPNRTVAALPEGADTGYCAALSDLQAALDHVTSRGMADKVILWGSSYSGALVFRLAVNNPRTVGGVLAFSPSSGGPLAECRARDVVEELSVPALVMRLASEMERDSSREQRQILEAAGVSFEVVEHGVHGSSMLLDERTGHDMSAARARVRAWVSELDDLL